MSAIPNIQKGKYYHRKTDHFYEVIDVALQTETDEWLVIYRPLWDSDIKVFARPYRMFVEKIELNGELKPRFEKVGE